MSDWLYGSELLILWGIKDFELLEYMIEGTLQPYDRLFKPIIPPNTSKRKEALKNKEQDLSDWERYWGTGSKMPNPNIEVNRVRYGTDYPGDYELRRERYESEIMSLKETLPKENEASWEHYEYPHSESDLLHQCEAMLKYLFRKEDIEKFAKQHGLKPPAKSSGAQPTDVQSQRNLLPNQMDKQKCREIAQHKWKYDSSLTISAMVISEEIKQQFGKMYKPKTIYKWIKDLCPDRRPGRRRTEKK
jgi:hypothetical protein